MAVHVQQTNFTAGELSPRLRGRVDLAKYYNGCQTLENFLIFPHGGITRRPGTRFVAAAKYADRPCRIMPFQFSTVQAYALEVGDGYIRFFKDQAQIWCPATDAAIVNGEFPANLNGWTSASGSGSSITWNSAGAMNLNSNGTTSGVARQGVAHTAGGTLHVISFQVLDGNIEVRVGATAGAEDILAAQTVGVGWHCREFTPPAGNTGFYVQFLNSVSGTATIDNVRLLDDEAVEVGAPYPYGVLREIGTTQSADVLFMAHESYPLHRLARYGHASWSVTPVTFAPSVETPGGLSGTLTEPTGETWSYKVTAVVSGTETLPSAAASVAGPPDLDGNNYITLTWNTVASATSYRVYRSVNGIYYLVGIMFHATAPSFTDKGVTPTSTEPPASGSTGPTGLSGTLTEQAPRDWTYVVTAEINGIESAPSDPVTVEGPYSLDNDSYVTLEWDPVDLAERYNVYRALNGVFYFVGQAYSLTAPTFVDNGVVLDKTSGAPIVQDPFEDVGYPATCVFHEQRFFLAKTGIKPQTVWSSKTGDFYNFTKSLPLRDDDRLIFTLDDSQVNAIQWLMAGRYLYLGTSSGEYFLSSSGGSGAITPTDFLCRRSTGYGSARIVPVQLGDVVIFVQNGGTCIRELAYRWESDSLTAPDLTVMAEHLFKDAPAVEMALTKLPDPHLYVIREDGQIAVLAYLKEHEVVGWSRIITDGAFETVATIPGDGRDEVWVSVRREIDGSDVRYIELFEEQFTADTGESAFFVDSGLSYSGTATATLSGLDHLEGKEVHILSDGAVVPPQTVSGGQIVMDRTVTQAHVGLPFTSVMSPVECEIPNNSGTSHGRVQRISRVMVRLFKTMGMKSGGTLDDLRETPFRDSFMPMGQAVSLFSGDLELSWDSANARENRIFIVQDKPLPMTILAMFMEATVYDR